MKLKLPESGPPVEAPIALGIAFAADVVVAITLLVVGPVVASRGGFEGVSWVPWAMAAYAILLVAIDLAVARMKPTALTWRRRLGYVAIVAIIWRRGPFADLPPLAIVAVIVWMGGTWIALVLAGRALSRAIAGATGEDKPE
jgi:hypothetical protein